MSKFSYVCGILVTILLTPSFSSSGIALRGTVEFSGQSQDVFLITPAGETASITLKTTGTAALQVEITPQSLH